MREGSTLERGPREEGDGMRLDRGWIVVDD